MYKRRHTLLVVFLCLFVPFYSLYWGCKTIDILIRCGHIKHYDIRFYKCILIIYPGWWLFAQLAEENIAAMRKVSKMKGKDHPIMYTLLGIFLPILLVGCVQSDLNDMTEYKFK